MPPTESAAREAPITATDRGRSRRWIDLASACCSRACMTATDARVGAISNDSRTTPESQRRATA